MQLDVTLLMCCLHSVIYSAIFSIVLEKLLLVHFTKVHQLIAFVTCGYTLRLAILLLP